MAFAACLFLHTVEHVVSPPRLSWCSHLKTRRECFSRLQDDLGGSGEFGTTSFQFIAGCQVFPFLENVAMQDLTPFNPSLVKLTDVIVTRVESARSPGISSAVNGRS